MAHLILPRRLTQQPNVLTGVDRSLPLSRGVIHAFDGRHLLGAVSNKSIVLAGTGSIAPTLKGNALIGNNTSATGSLALDLSPYKGFSYSGWVEFPDQSAIGSDDLLFEYTPDTNSNTGGFYIDMRPTSGSLDLAIKASVSYCSHRIPYPSTGWHYISFVVDLNASGYTTQLALYIDGVKAVPSAYPFTGIHSGAFPNSTLYLMSRNNSTLYLNSKLAGFVIHGRAINDQEAAALAANPWQIFKPSRQVLYFGVGGASTQTVNVTNASETNAAQSITVIPGARTISVANTTETNAAQAITSRGSYTFAFNPALETDTAQAITVVSARTLAVSAAAETDSAQAITAIVSGATSVGNASETDTAQTITPVPGAVTVAVGAATESDVAQAITALSGLTISLGAATEVGTVGAITPVPGGVLVTLNSADEQEEAQIITVYAPGNVTLTQADLAAIAAAVWADPTAVAAHAKLDAIIARITC